MLGAYKYNHETVEMRDPQMKEKNVIKKLSSFFIPFLLLYVKEQVVSLALENERKQCDF